MILLWFQKTLKYFFGYGYGMDTIMKHRQVVILMCGLMSDPTSIIHFVCARWIYQGQKSAGKTLIGLMYNETGFPVPKDFLHNQWINYYDHIGDLIADGWKTDVTPIYVPSRLYWFKKHGETYFMQHSTWRPRYTRVHHINRLASCSSDKEFIVNMSQNMSTSGSEKPVHVWRYM